LNTALQRKLAGPSLFFMLASLDWAEGKDAEMEKDLQAASGSTEGEVAVLQFRAGLAAARGQVRLARDFTRKAADAIERLHLQGRADLEAQLAGVEALVGNRTEAINEAEGALRSSPTFKVKWNAALALAAVGQEEKALRLADEIQRTRPNDTIAQNVAVPIIRAVVFLALANPAKAAPDKAIDLANSAALYVRTDSGVLFTRGLAYERARRYSEAEQDFLKIVGWKAVHGPDQVLPAAQLELARIYSQQGDASKARIAYQDFLATWKNADPDVPLLRQAKAEYAKLQ
jgi:eukaryotic-like serine/threonine-protein kinase